MYEGHWHNTLIPIRFCAVDSCITQPAQVAAIEKFAVCGWPGTMRTPWYEYSQQGLGIRSPIQNNTTTGSCCSGSSVGWCSSNEGIPRGYFPTFRDIVGTNKKVNLVCDLVSDVGKKVLVLGYDANGNWIRSNQSGTILDGELITLAQGAGTISTNFFSSVTDIQFNEDRDGQVWAYQYNNDTTIKTMIGLYQNWETRPNYLRTLFPSILSGASSNGSCNQTPVNALVKLNFWPVRVPTDFLCIPCLPALKHMIQAVNDSENEPDGVKKVQIIGAGIAAAKSVLNAQLSHFTGDGATPSIEVMGTSIYADNPIPNLV